MRKLWSIILSIALVCPFLAGDTVKAETTYNYGEAMQKAIMFYEFQRSGGLPEKQRNNWRGDSGLTDGADVGLDLTGGWYDAGDHVKFNLPMAYSAAMLAWAVYEGKDALALSGQLEYQMDNIKWVSDYLIKCHPEANVFYYQVGNGNTDHAWWGPAEVMQMDRPSYKIDLSNPGSTVAAEAAAALAATAVIYQEQDPAYSNACISHAKELFSFADNTKSDAGYTAANTFYSSSSGFYDELSWAGVWIYLATGEQTYLDKAEAYVANWNGGSGIAYAWAQNWDDVHYGTELLLAKITNKPIYKDYTEKHLDYWTTGYNGSRVAYTPKGLAWLDSWGSLRYATTTAFLASVYADWSGCTSSKVSIYNEFAKQQVDYALGSTGRSYVVGFGTNPPEHPHHRTAHSSWENSMSTPSDHRHTVFGALVGGPGKDDSYTDSINNYVNNEVACDYNAGFVGALVKMYEDYGGTPIENFTAMEQVTNDEFFVNAGITSSGSNYIEVKAVLNNQSGWPAKAGDKLSFKYFVDITEAVKAGYTTDNITVSSNYNESATISRLLPWDESNHIYYVDIDFTGTNIYPGGKSAYKKEVQFRISAPTGTSFWDNSNDFSFGDIKNTSSGTVVKATLIPVYDSGIKVYGNEPGNSETSSSISKTTASFDKSSLDQEDIFIDMTLNGNILESIRNGTAFLTEGTDYTISGNTVTINRSYLNLQELGKTNLTFDFSSGIDAILTITILNSSIISEGNIKVQMYNGNTSVATNGITPKFKLYNTGATNLKLSDVKIRYYYTIDGEAEQNFWCDWSSAGSGNVTGAFVKLNDSETGADYYLEVGFTEDAGILSAGKAIEVQTRFSKADWTNYIQNGDYSFNDMNSEYSDWKKVAGYICDVLQWGIEP